MIRRSMFVFALIAGVVAAQNAHDYVKPGGVSPGGEKPGPHITKIKYLIQNQGGRVDWLPNSNRIAYDSPNQAGFTDVHVMNSDGSDQRCVTCAMTNLSEYKGNPAWHPSGNYILFQATDPALPKTARSTQQYMKVTSPGSGWHNNLWVTTPDGSKSWQLTHVNAGQGLIHAHFDAAGKRVTWAQLTHRGGQKAWSLNVADFEVRGGVPQLSNAHAYTPGNLAFYETHCFSPDGSTILFTGKSQGYATAKLNYGIYAFTIAGGNLTMLADPKDMDWNEQAQFTPDGKHIIWMTSRGISQNREFEGDAYTSAFVSLKTEYWIMNPDGSNKQRLSYFNDPQSPMYFPGHVIASDLSFHTDTEMVSYIGDNSRHGHPGEIAIIDFAY